MNRTKLRGTARWRREEWRACSGWPRAPSTIETARSRSSWWSSEEGLGSSEGWSNLVSNKHWHWRFVHSVVLNPQYEACEGRYETSSPSTITSRASGSGLEQTSPFHEMSSTITNCSPFGKALNLLTIATCSQMSWLLDDGV